MVGEGMPLDTMGDTQGFDVIPPPDHTVGLLTRDQVEVVPFLAQAYQVGQDL